MTRIPGSAALALGLVAALSPLAARAQSSGNFTATVATTRCAIDGRSGDLTGGIDGHNVITTTIKTPNSKSTALVVRPSFVIGLFTRTRLNSDGLISTSTGNVGVKVSVLLDGNPVAPDLGDGVIYQQRFQSLSSNVQQQITNCVNDPALCFTELLQSSLAASSLDFVAPSVGGGEHTLEVSWTVDPAPVASTSVTTAACVGPGVVTVTQVKNFSQSAPIVID
jgi:hypothetical protein